MTSSDVVMIVIEGVLSSRVIVRSSVSGPFGLDPRVLASRQGHQKVLEKKEKEKRLRGRCRGLDPAPGRCVGVLFCVCGVCVCSVADLGGVCSGTSGH